LLTEYVQLLEKTGPLGVIETVPVYSEISPSWSLTFPPTLRDPTEVVGQAVLFVEVNAL
jgi:hypothetical protein